MYSLQRLIDRGRSPRLISLCNEYNFPCAYPRRDLSIMYLGNSEPITFCQKVYQINQDLSKSVSTLSEFVEKCINFIRSELVHGECT